MTNTFLPPGFPLGMGLPSPLLETHSAPLAFSQSPSRPPSHRHLPRCPAGLLLCVEENWSMAGCHGAGIERKCRHCGALPPLAPSRDRVWASLVVRWFRIYLSMQGTWLPSLVQEDPICCICVPYVPHQLLSRCSRGHALQQEKPLP